MTPVDPGSAHAVRGGDPAGDDRLYTPRFFRFFAAQALFMTGISLQFRFGQYFEYLGHDNRLLGRVLAASMIGTLLFRLLIGRWIDRFGWRPTWTVGAIVTAVSVVSISFVRSPWAIGTLRAAWSMAGAAVMTTFPVVAARGAPPHRRAESIGTQGLSGFLGMMIGPTAGDFILADHVPTPASFHLFFAASAVFTLAASLVVMVRSPKTDADAAPFRERGHEGAHAPTWAVIWTGWPGVLLIVGLVFGMTFSFQSMFLERMADARGFKNIKVFFLVYAPAAMILRVIFRRAPQLIGRTRVLVGGLALIGGGVFCLTSATDQSGLVIPGLLIGAGHCFVFPSMLDLAADRMPHERRGTATALILTAWDLGMLIGFLVCGDLIAWRGFELTLWVLGCANIATAIILACARYRAVFLRRRPVLDGGPSRRVLDAA